MYSPDTTKKIMFRPREINYHLSSNTNKIKKIKKAIVHKRILKE